MSTDTKPYRPLAPGMGQAVAERTILRKVLNDGVTLPPALELHPKDPDRGHMIRIAQESGIPVSLSDGQKLRFGSYLRWETWGEVAHRVALGNASLEPNSQLLDANTMLLPDDHDYHVLNHHLRQASLLMSGRHLQHSDINQRFRNMEVSTL